MFYRHYEDVELRSLSPSNIYYTKILGNQSGKDLWQPTGKTQVEQSSALRPPPQLTLLPWIGNEIKLRYGKEKR